MSNDIIDINEQGASFLRNQYHVCDGEMTTMANYGNTGQRYNTRKIVALDTSDSKVVRTLACGHSTESTWESPLKALQVVGWSQGDIGKRTRCNQCEKASA